MSALWQPTWQATHAYALTAVVIPTAFGGYTWRCTTAGTSAGVEPVWPDPTLGTTTIADGTVMWSVGTGFRQALSGGIVSLVATFAHANPTIIRSVRSVRPYAFANVELPCFYIGALDESILTFQGNRIRTFAGFDAFLVDDPGALKESNDRMDFAADVLADLFTANQHAASGRSNFQHVGTTDTQEQDGSGAITYPALQFTFGETQVTEGRP